MTPTLRLSCSPARFGNAASCKTDPGERTIRAKWLSADCRDLKPFDLKR